MKTICRPWLSVALLILLLAAVLPSAAEATAACRSNKGGSSTDALGEEYPERACWPVLFGLELPFLRPLFVVWDNALGEEFPEKSASSGPCDALGEEFPEKTTEPAPADALGEEFPE